MADRSKQLIEQMTETIFRNRKESEYKILNEQLSALTANLASKGLSRSGAFIRGVGKLYGEYLVRVLTQTLEELRLDAKETGRRDSEFFWDVVGEKLSGLANSVRVSLLNSSIDYCKSHGGLSASDNSLVSQVFYQYGDGNSLVQVRVAELRIRSQFQTMKSPADRKANQIPDVAVMMWFPKKEDTQNHEHAQKKYEAIQAAIHEASNGQATVDKIDNPNLVHQDRISPSVERWLEKSVLVICDLEGNRPNVFYEFGYTRAIGTDVMATRPIGQATDFHLAQWNIDEYSDLEDLKTKLVPRLKTVLSRYDLSGSLVR